MTKGFVYLLMELLIKKESELWSFGKLSISPCFKNGKACLEVNTGVLLGHHLKERPWVQLKHLINHPSRG